MTIIIYLNDCSASELSKIKIPLFFCLLPSLLAVVFRLFPGCPFCVRNNSPQSCYRIVNGLNANLIIDRCDPNHLHS